MRAMARRNTAEKKRTGKSAGGSPTGPNIWVQMLIAIGIFVLLSGGYSLVRQYIVNQSEEVPISQIVDDINAGRIASIVVAGDSVTATYTDKKVKTSHKEAEVSLTQTFANYGVVPEKLTGTKIEIKDQNGPRYWFLTLAPLIIPVILLFAMIWYLSRQLRGGGMQALTFGRSMARLVRPEDQKVTFADVAGAKEAKVELLEIVDFLKNPKKFIQIGASIPKGVLLMGAPGTGKCVTGDTQLVTNKGMVPIADVPKYFTVRPDSTVEGLDVVSIDPQGLTFDTVAASHWYDLGDQETKIVETEIGARIEGTPEHPIVVVNDAGQLEFKRLDEITDTSYVVMSRGARLFGHYTRVPDVEAAYLLGVLVGDGCMTIKDRVIVSTQDLEVLERVQSVARAHLGGEFVKTTSRPYDYELRSAQAKTILRSWGIEETYARNKRVPEWIRLAPHTYVCAFLRGLFDVDGSVERYGSVTLSSANRRLIEEVHAILLNIGIVARIYDRRKKYNGELQSYLAIYADFVELFRDEIGFTVAYKRECLESLIVRQRNTNINVIPNQGATIQAIWQQAVVAEPRDRAFYAQSLYKNTKRYIIGERMPSVSGMQTFIAGATELASALVASADVAYLKRLSSGDFFFTKVSSVGSGRARVYDLTIPRRHNFVANGFINHNTLLARAVAGEAGVPFFSISGSEFVEMFVGVGASRVRDLFDTAKKTAPAIVFIDEIDAVGRARGVGTGGGNDEREQTLNQILVEMDGFEPNEKVIVMAATNRPDVLDPALLRPGRFDRRVTIDVPDRKDREEILNIHARKKPLGPDVTLSVIAERTPGFSGADLANLMNEAAILAARENRQEITQYDLIRSIEKVMLGPERRSHVLNAHEKEITAYHEAGHALVASVLPYADPVHKISIISRGRAAGYTLKLPFEEKKMQSRKEFFDDIAVSLGGYVAEKIVFDDVTTGASNDLQVLSALARDMVTRYGMSERMGPIAFDAAVGRTLFGGGIEGGEQSEEVAAQIDAEVKKIITDAHKKAEEVIINHRAALNAIAKKLVEVETIEREEFEQILIANGITPKKKEDIIG
jgi:ATP-dependent metalloprotease FtsH